MVGLALAPADRHEHGARADAGVHPGHRVDRAVRGFDAHALAVGDAERVGLVRMNLARRGPATFPAPARSNASSCGSARAGGRPVRSSVSKPCAAQPRAGHESAPGWTMRPREVPGRGLDRTVRSRPLLRRCPQLHVRQVDELLALRVELGQRGEAQRGTSLPAPAVQNSSLPARRRESPVPARAGRGGALEIQRLDLGRILARDREAHPAVRHRVQALLRAAARRRCLCTPRPRTPPDPCTCSCSTSSKPKRLPSSIQIQSSDFASPGGSIILSIHTMRRSSLERPISPFSMPVAAGST
jgi:hypothetical protein